MGGRKTTIARKGKCLCHSEGKEKKEKAHSRKKKMPLSRRGHRPRARERYSTVEHANCIGTGALRRGGQLGKPARVEGRKKRDLQIEISAFGGKGGRVLPHQEHGLPGGGKKSPSITASEKKKKRRREIFKKTKVERRQWGKRESNTSWVQERDQGEEGCAREDVVSGGGYFAMERDVEHDEEKCAETKGGGEGVNCMTNFWERGKGRETK